MKKETSLAISAAVVALAVGFALAASSPIGENAPKGRRFAISADRMAVDNVTKVAVATGHVHAVSEPLHLRTESARTDTNGVVRLADPTVMTTCTNHPGICHWDLCGEIEYKNGKYLEGRNVWVHFYEIPVFWLPYLYYPLDSECSFRIMPGYLKRWGAYVMMKYNYDIIGNPNDGEDALWLYGNTRFDLRYENGIALGETLNWNLGRFGRGHFKIYYAWDADYDRYEIGSYNLYDNYYNWGSSVPYNRYIMELAHHWDITERDILRLKGTLTSDSYFRHDFMRRDFWTIGNEWMGSEGNEVAWEHNESLFGTGLSVSGPLNEFYGGTGRLPELYVDVVPTPVFDLPINYETENRIGYLTRRAAEYGNGNRRSPYSYNPGPWAEYETFRLDTYHRLTAPFKVEDVLSVVPRLGYRGTLWNQTGLTDLEGWNDASNQGDAFRSIGEIGLTLAGRGKAWLDEKWQHTVEPYFDVLAQEAWYNGIDGNNRPYVFDSIDASVNWEDQFAGRGRNLPYSYYGVTPGLRNSFEKMDEHGSLRTILDFDVYAAIQFNSADWIGSDDCHKLAVVGDPNYGKSGVYATPGARIRWLPTDDITLSAQAEYDPDGNTVPLADFAFVHKVTDDFSYFLNYNSRFYRVWDFSSTPYDERYMNSDDFNRIRYDNVYVGFTQHPIDWFAWSPFLRWDCHAGELDGVGSWFDYLTDCLGFRLVLEYRNKYTRIDGSEYDEDVHVGFFVYLRALGPSNGGMFGE